MGSRLCLEFLDKSIQGIIDESKEFIQFLKLVVRVETSQLYIEKFTFNLASLACCDQLGNRLELSQEAEKSPIFCFWPRAAQGDVAQLACKDVNAVNPFSQGSWNTPPNKCFLTLPW